MRNVDSIVKILLSDDRSFEYHMIDGFLTDNSNVFIENVPQGKVYDVLYVVCSLFNCCGLLYASYSELFEFSYRNVQ